MRRPILVAPDPILRAKSAPVADPSVPDIQALITDLKDSCLAAEGIGLAAPQIGVSQRVIVVNDPRGSPYALINPEITWASLGTSTMEEGCLSVPGVTVPVPRPRKVRVRAFDEKGARVEKKADNLLSKVLQHEIDHLNGVLIIDYRQEAVSGGRGSVSTDIP